MFFIIYLLLFVLILGFSWQAFIQAYLDPSLVYLPLKSFFLAIKFTPDSPFYGLPAWLLANTEIKPFLAFKILNEILLGILAIVFILIFLKILELKYWFKEEAEPNAQLGIKAFIKSFPEKIKGFFAKVKDFKEKKNKNIFVPIFMPRNIFDLDYAQITLLSLVISFVAIFYFPSDSSDLFGYVARGAQQAIFDQNPFAEPVAQISNWEQNPLLGNFLWSQNPSPYGPFFMMLCKSIINLSFNNFWLALFLFKLMGWVIFFLLILLIYTMLNDQSFCKHLFKQECNGEYQTKIKKIIYALIALNPFLIVECIWNAHNDIYMAFFILFALYMCFKKNFNLALIALCCASLIKYFSVILLPFFFIYYLRSSSKLASESRTNILGYLGNFPFVGLVFSIGISYYVFNLYKISEFQLTKITDNLILSHKSFFDCLNSLYKYISHQDLPNTVKHWFLVGFAIFVIYMFVKYLKSFKELDLFEYSFWILFALIFIASPKFHSWYLCSILPLMSLIKPRLAVILSCTHLLSLTFIDQANILNFVLMTGLPVAIYLKSLHRLDTSKI